MSNTYLLLRNNIERGPFTIDQLLQQQLVPEDLLWVEGKSREWKYLREIIDLGFALANENSIPFPGAMLTGPAVMRDNYQFEKPIPIDSVGNKAGKSIDSYGGDPSASQQKNLLPAEEEPIEFIYHRRKKSSPIFQLLAFTLVVILMALAWHRNTFFKAKDNNDQTAIPLVSATEHTAMASQMPSSPRAEKPVVIDSAKNAPKTEATSIQPEKIETVAKDKYKALPSKLHTKYLRKITAPALIKVNKRKEEQKIALPEIIPAPGPAPEKKLVLPQPQEQVAVTERKKSFGQVLRGIFKKKKKDEKPGGLME